MTSIAKLIQRMESASIWKTLKSSFSSPSKDRQAQHQETTSTPTYDNTSSAEGGTPLGNYEPSKPTDLSAEAQKAIWASAIIKKIRYAQPITSVQSSLRDQILSLTIDKNQCPYEMDQSYKDQILNLFETGKTVDDNVFNQMRIISARTEGSNITFFPTEAVFKTIFQILMFGNPCIVIGSYGIGKTFSYLLFSHLASYPNQLKYLALSKWIQKQRRQKYKSELRMLMKQKLIVNPPKIWYWSISEALNETDQSVTDLIKSQLIQDFFSQSVTKEILSCKNVNEVIQKIKQLHYCEDKEFRKQFGKYFIRSMPVYDQINVVIAAYRNWNSAMDRNIYDGKNVEQARAEIDKDKRQRLDNANRIKQLIKQYGKLGAGLILNSSSTIQEQLINDGQTSLPSYYQMLKIFNHGLPQKRQIHYASLMKQQSTQIEFCQQFLFKMEQQCRGSKQLFEKFSYLKQNLTKEQLIVKNYYRFLFVRNYFQSHSGLNLIKRFKIQALTSPQQVQKFAADVFKDFNKFCLQSSKERLLKFINKGNDDNVKFFKRIMIQIMNEQAKKCLQSKKNQLIFDAKSLENVLKRITKQSKPIRDFIAETNQQLKKENKPTTQQISIKDYFETSYHNKQLIPAKYNLQQNTIQIEWTPQEFLEISNFAIYDFKIELLNQLKKQPLQEGQRFLLEKYPDYRGIKGEYYIEYLLFKSKSVCFSNRSNANFSTLPTQSNYQIGGSKRFKAFNHNRKMNKRQISIQQKSNSKKSKKKDANIKKESNYEQAKWTYVAKLRQNMSRMFQLAKENPDKSIIGFPTGIIKVAQIQEQRFCRQSEAFDLAIVKYQSKSDIFDITLVDITFTKSKQEVMRKQKKSLEIIKALLRKVEKYKDRQQLKPSKEYQKDLAKWRISQQQVDTLDQNNYRIHQVILCRAINCKAAEIVSKDLLTSEFYQVESIQFKGVENTKLLRQYQTFLKIIQIGVIE